MIVRSARFSDCRAYRYTLLRVWDTFKPPAMFIGLNPSTADETQDDPTVRRCIGYARDWGYGALMMANIFAWRATDPRIMKVQEDPVGPVNDHTILSLARQADIVVAAWGNHGAFLRRSQAVTLILEANEIELLCLGYTKSGHPKHPLYLPRDLTPVPYELP